MNKKILNERLVPVSDCYNICYNQQFVIMQYDNFPQSTMSKFLLLNTLKMCPVHVVIYQTLCNKLFARYNFFINFAKPVRC